MRIFTIGIPFLKKKQPPLEDVYRKFDEIVQTYVKPSDSVLDAGCGLVSRANLKGKCKLFIGVDLDNNISKNNTVDEKIIASIDNIPVPNGTFDMIISFDVIEHLENPEKVFSEFQRISKKGAFLILETPNILHHMNFIAFITPHSWHNWYLKYLQHENFEAFITRYKANTVKKLSKLLKNQGFCPIKIELIDYGPKYSEWFTPLYIAGLIIHKILNKFEFLSPFRSEIFAVYKKE